MDKHEYLLTIRIPLQALDTAEGRMMAKQIVGQVDSVLKDVQKETKFQRLFPGRPPEGIQL